MQQSLEQKSMNVGPDRLATKPLARSYLEILIACAIFLAAVFFLPHEQSWALRATVGVSGAGIWLWIAEPIPMALTALLIIVTIPIVGAANLDTSLMGFANGSTFLIMAGFMMARGVNITPLGKRIASLTLIRFGGSVKGVLAGVLLAPYALSLFIPATAVRTTLLLPAVLGLIGSMGLANNSRTAKILVLGLAFGAQISGAGLIPAAVANVLTVDMLRTSLNQPVYYFDWLKMTWPVWVSMLPITWFILLKVFPPEVSRLNIDELRKELRELGGLTVQEKKCMAILALTVLLWMTESVHKLPTAVPAMLAVVLMGMPGIGFASWEKLKNIDWGTVLLMGATLSLAGAINKSGAAGFLAGKLLALPALQQGLSVPLAAVVLLTLLTQVYHLGVSNVSTVVVTLTPVVLQLALKLGVNPLMAAMTINLAALFGFLLVVETLPGVITYATGLYTQRDLLRAGMWLTLASMAVIILTALVWWPLIGLN